jgi:hypothetical protein
MDTEAVAYWGTGRSYVNHTGRSYVNHNTYPLNSNVQLIEEAITLPYQKGSTLRDANTPTKVLSDYRCHQLRPMLDLQMSQNQTYQPTCLNTMVNLKANDELEKKE